MAVSKTITLRQARDRALLIRDQNREAIEKERAEESETILQQSTANG